MKGMSLKIEFALKGPKSLRTRGLLYSSRGRREKQKFRFFVFLRLKSAREDDQPGKEKMRGEGDSAGCLAWATKSRLTRGMKTSEEGTIR